MKFKLKFGKIDIELTQDPPPVDTRSQFEREFDARRDRLNQRMKDMRTEW